jgi:hypothetical protein
MTDLGEDARDERGWHARIRDAVMGHIEANTDRHVTPQADLNSLFTDERPAHSEYAHPKHRQAAR